MSRLALVLLAALCLTACGAGGDSLAPTVPPGGTGTSQSMSEGEMAWALEVLNLVNQERAKMQLPPVEWHEQASGVAYGHSVDMDVRAFFDHVNPDGDDPGDRLRAAGIDWRTYGENIAMGHSSPGEVMAAWMNSPGHRANILEPQFTHLGVGVHSSYQGGPWWTQNFLR